MNNSEKTVQKGNKENVSNPKTENLSEYLVNEQFKLLELVGSGSFGRVYSAISVSNNSEVAIKLEATNAKHHRLLPEHQLYTVLNGGPGIPKIHWFGQFRNYNAMVMDLLGPNLHALFKSFKRFFTKKTVLMLIDNMIDMIEYVHSKNIIHRDIKPNNFVIGLNNNRNKLYLIDFGMSKFYKNNLEVHIPHKDYKRFVGTPFFASINALSGIEQSRRDDMESLFYLWLYLVNGSLPWTSLDSSNKPRRNESILELKKNIPIEDLCEGLPMEFSKYFAYCRQLKFDETPDYSKQKEMFRSLFYSFNYTYDWIYDWMLSEHKLNEKK